MTTTTPFELVFFDSASTKHVPPFARDHATAASAIAEAQRVYPLVVNRKAHTPMLYGPGLPAEGVLALPAHRAESYPGEALDTAMMLARLDYPESEIATSVATNFPDLPVPALLAADAVIAVGAERAEQGA